MVGNLTQTLDKLIQTTTQEYLSCVYLHKFSGHHDGHSRLA